MPDINLAENTNRPELGNKTPRPLGEPQLTDPGAPKSGIGGMFRGLFHGKAAPIDPVPGTPVRKAAQATQRILSEKRTDNGPSLIPLPEMGELEVNLISEEMSHQFSARQKSIQLALFALGAVVIVAAGYVGLTLYEKSLDTQVAQTKQEVAAVKKEVTTLQKDSADVQLTTEKVKAIRTLLGNHVHWTQFFTQLEQYTLPSVTYGSSFSANIQGSITLSAKTDTFEHAAQQYLLFKQAVERKDFIKTFSITAATKQTEKETTVVGFSVTLELLPSLFTDRIAAAPAKNTDLLDAACYILGHQDILTTFPQKIRNEFVTAKLPVTAASCSQVDATALDHGRTIIAVDDDKDGLANYFELLAGTPVDVADTDKDTILDLDEVLNCTDPRGPGATPSCDLLRPIIPRI